MKIFTGLLGMGLVTVALSLGYWANWADGLEHFVLSEWPSWAQLLTHRVLLALVTCLVCNISFYSAMFKLIFK